MRANQLLLTLTVAVISLISIGCSSGGGDSTTPTDPATSFSLLPSNYFTDYNKTTNFTGSDSNGSNYTVTWSEQTGVQTTFLGVPAIPILTQLQLTNTTSGAFTSLSATQYYSTSASDRHYLGDVSNVSATVSATTTALPQTSTIGAFGVIGTYIDNAGDIDEEAWRLEDGGNGRAKLVLLFNSKDQFGNATSSETQSYLIDANGNRLSATIVFFDNSSGVTLTVNGS